MANVDAIAIPATVCSWFRVHPGEGVVNKQHKIGNVFI